MSYLLAFIGFSALIILHEAGHFLVAKRVGMKATKFYLFFPPKLVAFRRGETEYGIGAVPLGGFVKIVGMTPDELRSLPDQDGCDPETGLLLGDDEAAEIRDDHARAYCRQATWKRVAVIFAGPGVNFLIAIGLFYLVASGYGLDSAVARVGHLVQGSPAEKVLEVGDRVVAVDGVAVEQLRDSALFETVKGLIDQHRCPGPQPEVGCTATTPVKLLIRRDGVERELSIRPEYTIPPGSPRGDGPRPLVGFRYGVKTFPQSSREGIAYTVDRMREIVVDGVFGIVPRIFDSDKRDEISSVVGIYEVTRESIEFGPREAFAVLASISLVLAVMNLMPFLPLDGGHIAWALAEKVRGRPISVETMFKVSSVGIVFLVIVVTIGLTNDIGKLTGGEGFGVR